MILMLASLWRINTKAGKPGWATIIPVYNTIVLLEIARKPVWWIVLFLIPGVSFIMWIITVAAIASNFGKGVGFVLGMLFLPAIFFPILAFGSAQYIPEAPPQYGLPQARAYY